jgi:crotonobetainyl-CoA:carnitine CoA-transferase CaiB-like acyl-CoA transferase
MLGLQNEREWVLFCERVLKEPALATDARFASNSRRTDNRQALRALIVQTFAGLSSEQVVERLEEAQIANARINDMHDLWRHEQLRSRRRWVEVETPAGQVPALLPPGTTRDGGVRMDPVPALGQHTDAILAELGCSPMEIAALREAKAI